MANSTIAAMHMTIEPKLPELCTVSVLILDKVTGEYAAYRQARTYDHMATREVLNTAGDAFEHGYKLTEAEARKAFTKELNGQTYRR